MALLRDDLRDRARRFPDRPAVRVVDGKSLTFAEWNTRSDAVARGLVARGVRRGDRVALLFDNAAAVEFHVSYIAAHRAGAAAVPINARYAAREVAHVLSDCTPRVVLSSGRELPRARELGSDALVPDEVASSDGSPYDEPITEDDLADVFYTSGTTGLPKGVASTHGNTAANPLGASEQGGVLLHSIPLSTFTGVQGGVITPMRLALTSVVLPRFDALRFASLIESECAQSLLMVPAHISLLLDSGALGKHDMSSVGLVMFGGAPTPPAVVSALAAALPRAMLFNGYGLTEAGSSVCVLPPEEAARRPGSVGKPMPGVEIRIVDEAGAEVSAGEVGEILLRIPSGRRSYFGDDAATAATWRDGWVRTGDLGRLDSDGFLYVVDRSKDMVIRGGYNVYSVEVESALHEHPDVLEAAVVGIPHRVLGQDVCAVVRLRRGSPPLDVESVRTFLTDRLADYKQPRRVVMRSTPLPRNAMGKLDKKAILAELSGDQLEQR